MFRVWVFVGLGFEVYGWGLGSWGLGGLGLGCRD